MNHDDGYTVFKLVGSVTNQGSTYRKNLILLLQVAVQRRQ